MRLLFIWLAVIAILITLLMAGGCRVQKDVSKAKTTVDARISELRDSFGGVISNMKARYENQLNELKEQWVIFDETPAAILPSIDSSCNEDSLVKIIRLQDDIVRSVKNRLKINADGSIEAEGRILSANVKKELAERMVIELEQRNDSLQRVINQQSKDVHAEMTTKEKHKKTGIPIWWFILTGIGSIALWEYKLKKWFWWFWNNIVKH